MWTNNQKWFKTHPPTGINLKRYRKKTARLLMFDMCPYDYCSDCLSSRLNIAWPRPIRTNNLNEVGRTSNR